MDWSIPQTVASDNLTIIVLTDGTCTERTFGGTVIFDSKHDTTLGRYIEDFRKNAYNPCDIHAVIKKLK